MSDPSPSKPVPPSSVSLKVHNPTGVFEVRQMHAPRLSGLNGKTIAELSNGGWQDQRTFEVIRRLITEKFPDAKIIPYSEFPIGSERIDQESTIDLVVARGAEAVITGNAA